MLNGETQCHLGLGKEGEKASYLKVQDYVTVLNKGTDEDEVGRLLDGSMFVPKVVQLHECQRWKTSRPYNIQSQLLES